MYQYRCVGKIGKLTYYLHVMCENDNQELISRLKKNTQDIFLFSRIKWVKFVANSLSEVCHLLIDFIYVQINVGVEHK
jgi:hypothetical protein